MKNNYAQAKLLLRLEKRLESQPEVKEKYCQKIQAAISEGHIEKISNDPNENSSMKYFIPHFNTSQATFRVVYDAAREYHGISLNGMLTRGPIFLQSLQSILFRFGEKKYGVASDISNMFFQIRIHEGDRDMLRILWFDEPNMRGKVTQFRFLVAPYSLRCIPSMAGYALHYTAERNVPNVSASTTECVKRDMFVDDLILGADTVEEGQQLVGEVSKLLSSMGFKLTMWNSNEKEILRDVDPEDAAPAIRNIHGENASGEATHQQSTLGLVWYTVTDQLFIKKPDFNKCSTQPFTMRQSWNDSS